MANICMSDFEFWFLWLWGPFFILVHMKGGFFIQRLHRNHGAIGNPPVTLREYTIVLFPGIFAGIISGTMVLIAFKPMDLPNTVMSIIISVIFSLGLYIYGYVILQHILLRFEQ